MAPLASLLADGVAPLHAGHEGGGAFDSYNLAIGGIVLAALIVVGVGIWWLVKRRRNVD